MPAGQHPTVPPDGSTRVLGKGARTRQAVLAAATKVIAEQGLAAASQEQVASAAGISQSALRHHFPTKANLISAVFDASLDRHRAAVEQTLLQPGLTPRERLTQMAADHLAHIASASDAYAYEAYAFWARDPDARHNRDAWYAWLAGHYRDLLALANPALSGAECTDRACTIITITIGAWATAGCHRPDLGVGSPERIHRTLLATIDNIIDAPAHLDRGASPGANVTA